MKKSDINVGDRVEFGTRKVRVGTVEKIKRTNILVKEDGTWDRWDVKPAALRPSTRDEVPKIVTVMTLGDDGQWVPEDEVELYGSEV